MKFHVPVAHVLVICIGTKRAFVIVYVSKKHTDIVGQYYYIDLAWLRFKFSPSTSLFGPFVRGVRLTIMIPTLTSVSDNKSSIVKTASGKIRIDNIVPNIGIENLDIVMLVGLWYLSIRLQIVNKIDEINAR